MHKKINKMNLLDDQFRKDKETLSIMIRRRDEIEKILLNIVN